MSHTLVSWGIVFISLSPAILLWLRARRLAKLANAELRIAKAVTSMEEHMLKGSTTNGQVCHDLVFKVMFAVQGMRRYSVSWNILKKPTADQCEARSRFEAELADDQHAFGEIIEDFVRAHFEAFSLKHPIRYKAYFAYNILLYITSKGLLYFLRTLLQCVDGWHRAKDRLRHKYFLDAGTEVIA